MKRILPTLIGGLSLFVPMLHAQQLLPELQPLATKHKTDTEALVTQRDAALTRVRQEYGMALNSAEKAASAAGQVAAVAAITQERTALTSGSLPPLFPAALPKSLQPIRKTYTDAATRAAAEFAPRFQRVDGDYLRALSALQARAAAGSPLANQITDEKARLLEAATAKPGTVAKQDAPGEVKRSASGAAVLRRSLDKTVWRTKLEGDTLVFNKEKVEFTYGGKKNLLPCTFISLDTLEFWPDIAGVHRIVTFSPDLRSGTMVRQSDRKVYQMTREK